MPLVPHFSPPLISYRECMPRKTCLFQTTSISIYYVDCYKSIFVFSQTLNLHLSKKFTLWRSSTLKSKLAKSARSDYKRYLIRIIVDLPDVAMSGHVSVEIRDMTKGLVADTALVGRGRTMRCLVLLQMGLLTEPLMAHNTLKWTFS